MQYSKTGLELTEKFEGCKLTAYQDSVGRWTIGYGHTAGVKPDSTITQEQAEAFLSADIAWCEALVNKIVTVPLAQFEFDALVDFAFNLGPNALIHSTLLTLINKGDFTDAANEFDKWDHAGGKFVAGLLRRRQSETDEFKGVTNATETKPPTVDN